MLPTNALTSQPKHLLPGRDLEEIETPLHRLREVCQREGVSHRSAARSMGVKVSEIKRQQREDTDLRLSELYRWSKILDVPVTELLMEPNDELATPLLCRARLVRLMKSARAIEESSSALKVKRLVRRIIDQLIEVMPELDAIHAWHSVGRRRGSHELGRIVEHSISDDQLQPRNHRGREK